MNLLTTIASAAILGISSYVFVQGMTSSKKAESLVERRISYLSFEDTVRDALSGYVSSALANNQISCTAPQDGLKATYSLTNTMLDEPPGGFRLVYFENTGERSEDMCKASNVNYYKARGQVYFCWKVFNEPLRKANPNDPNAVAGYVEAVVQPINIGDGSSISCNTLQTYQSEPNYRVIYPGTRITYKIYPITEKKMPQNATVIRTTYSTSIMSENIATEQGCRIKQSQCLQYPAYVGNFKDDLYPASSNSLNACFNRAKDYSVWCRNTLGMKTTAIFTDRLGIKTSETYSSILGCVITQDACVIYPTYVGQFSDNWDGSGASAARCLSRAYEYGVWCANPAGTRTVATYVDLNGVFSSKSYSKNARGCFIAQAQCVRYPTVVGLFYDGDSTAHTNASRCAARASEWANHCGNPSRSYTDSEYYDATSTSINTRYIVP